MRVNLILSAFAIFSFPLSAVLVSVDPDSFSAGTDISTAFSYVTLSSGGGASGLDGKVYAAGSSQASTGDNVFANSRISPTLWLNKDVDGYFLRIDFVTPTHYVSIDLISDNGFDYPSVWFYTTAGNLIKRNYLSPLGVSQVYHAVIERETADIAYIRAGGLDMTGSTVLLDNLKFEVPEPATCLILLSSLLILKNRKKQALSSVKIGISRRIC
jgi:hypothetical protein